MKTDRCVPGVATRTPEGTRSEFLHKPSQAEQSFPALTTTLEQETSTFNSTYVKKTFCREKNTLSKIKRHLTKQKEISATWIPSSSGCAGPETLKNGE